MKRNIIVLLFLSICQALTAQTSPGGVRGAELWFHTELQDGYQVWVDQSGDATQLKIRLPGSTAENLYKLPASMVFYFNFHPALDFPHLTGSHIYASLQHTALHQSTHMGVFAPTPLRQSLLGNAPFTLTRFSSAMPSHSVWGEETVSSVAFPPAGFQGYIPEYIVWQRILNPLERLQAESYLALKYGITLNSSYYDAHGNIIWDRDENSAYYYRVTGLTHESSAQSQFPYLSTTSYEYAGTPAIPQYKQAFAANAAPLQPSSDHLLIMGRLPSHPMSGEEHLVWGDNQGGLAAQNISADTCHWHYMNRRWKVSANTTDSVAKCNTAIFNYKKTNDPGFISHPYGHIAMIIDPSGSGDFSEIDDSFRFAHYESHDSIRGVITFHGFELNNGDVFTFGWTDQFIAEFTPHEATCLNSSTSSSDGCIDVDIISGVPRFDYQLKVLDVPGDSPNHILRTGSFTSYNMSITGLKSGTYELIIGEVADMGGSPNIPIRLLSRHVTVGSECLGIENGVQSVNPGLSDMARRRTDGSSDLSSVQADSPLTLSPSESPLTFTARLDAPGQAMLLVCTTGGILLSQQHFPAGLRGRECTFTVPRPGVYIIKAVTDTDEYGHKLIAK